MFGWVELRQVFARSLPQFSSPVVIWHPGDSTPDFGSISHLLKSRFRDPATAITVVIASKQTGNKYGFPAGRAPRPSETTHDLALAAVYLLYTQIAPSRAAAWISESRLIEAGEGRASKLADALIRLPSGDETVIEFGGEYSKQKLLSFHEDCAERERSYELW